MRSSNPFLKTLILIGSAALFASCGGGGGGSSSGFVTPTGSTTYSISGTVSGDIKQGVTVKLNNASTATTDAGGSYTFSGLSNGTYTVTASKTSYSFAPTSISATVNSANSSGNDFTATAVLYSVSGSVSGDVTDGVTISISGTTEGGIAFSPPPTQSSSGAFTFTNLVPNGTYTVTPSKAGYSFSPVSQSVIVNNAGASTAAVFASSIDPRVKFTLSGAVSGAIRSGVLMTLSGSASATANTGAAGNYEFSVPNGTYAVAASKSGYTFSPPNVTNRVINSVNLTTGNDFTAIANLYSLTGTLSGPAMAGANISVTGSTEGGASITPVNAIADVNGVYAAVNSIPNGSYTVTPTAAVNGYLYLPTSRAVTVGSAAVNGVDFASVVNGTVLYDITGSISGDILGNVTITASGALNGIEPITVTGPSNGSGSFNVPVPNGTYDLTPSKAGYTFTPAAANLTINGGGSSGHNFTASAIPYTISGSMTGAALNGLTVTITGATESGASIAPVVMTTNSFGAYSAGNIPNGTYTITPSGAANIYSIVPTSRLATVAAGNVVDRNFDVQLLADEHETDATGCSTDDTYQCSGAIGIGTSQQRTLFPDVDVDWVRVSLPAGVYEFSANDLGNAGDVVMSLYDCTNSFITGGPSPILLVDGTAIPLVDDYIGLDSRIKYTVPVGGGIYCMEIKRVDWVVGIYHNGVTRYALNVHQFNDGDLDLFSDFYDCNDSNSSIFPGVQGCPAAYNGNAVVTGDNTALTSHPMMPSSGDGWEFQLHPEIFAANGRELSIGNPNDVFSITIPAKSAVYVQVAVADLASFGTTIYATQVDASDAVVPLNSNFCYSSAGVSVSGDACKLDALEIGLSGLFIENTSTAAKTVYVKFDAGGDTGYYVPFYYNIGTDNDGDGYYTLDWPGWRDCNDNDWSIKPGQGCGTTVP